MKTPRTFVLMRHPMSTDNQEEREDGYVKTKEASERLMKINFGDAPLTPIGYQQAGCAGRWAYKEGLRFNKIFASSMLRAQQGADVFAAQYPESLQKKMPIEISRLIREVDSGICSRMTKKDALKYYPFRVKSYESRGWYYFVPPEGGESAVSVQEGRSTQFWKMLCEMHAGENVLAVSHGGSSRTIRALIEDWDDHRWKEDLEIDMENCTMYIYEYSAAHDHLIFMKKVVPWKIVDNRVVDL